MPLQCQDCGTAHLYQMEIQTRSDINGINMFESFEAAMREAENDETIWKISFSLPNGERIRLVKEGGYDPDKRWIYDPIVD
jgi:hypothetical protein